jgi:hypothetical protein
VRSSGGIGRESQASTIVVITHEGRRATARFFTQRSWVLSRDSKTFQTADTSCVRAASGPPRRDPGGAFVL